MVLDDAPPLVNAVPALILVVEPSRTTIWSARDIAATDEGVWLYISDRIAKGWHAARSGAVLHLIPRKSDPAPHMEWVQ